MKTEINNELLRSFNPCYDPSEIGIPDDETLSVKDWIDKYKDKVKSKSDVIWVICRNDFMTNKDLRLFAVWCAREALKLFENPDHRSINACDVAERYANGEATREELDAAWDAARDAARAAARAAARDAARAAARDAARAAAWDAARDAAWAAARDAAWDAAWDAQIEQLKTYFK
jgi:hypothetical protein